MKPRRYILTFEVIIREEAIERAVEELRQIAENYGPYSWHTEIEEGESK